jgi:polyhydroxyalkanoate synthesis regulator protein
LLAKQVLLEVLFGLKVGSFANLNLVANLRDLLRFYADQMTMNAF